MEKKSIFNFSIIIPLLGLIVSLLVLLLGNNIFDRFTEPKIALETTAIEMKYPNDVMQALNDYSTKNKISFLPGYYKIIIIRNIGFIASKNANIQIQAGGDIFDISSFSTESILEKKQIDNSTYNIQMPRLSKNAYIEIKIWTKNNNQPISVIYADDYNSRQLIENNLDNKSFPIIEILIYTIAVMSIFFIVKYMFLKFLKSLEEKRVQQEYEMVIKLSEMISEKEEVILHKVSEQDDEETKEKLKRLIRKVKDNL